MMYAKALLAIVVSAGGALVTALGTGHTDFSNISTQNWLIAAGTVLGSGGLVWFTENTAAAPIIKAVTAFLSAGVASLVIADQDMFITKAEWITAFTTAVVALSAVYQVSNKPATVKA